MIDSLPTWLRTFRFAAIAAAIFQIIYSAYPFSTGFTVPWFVGVGMVIVTLAPWLCLSKAWMWWPSYLFLVWITYRLVQNIVVVWSNYLNGNSGSFLGWSTEIKFMVIYVTVETLFLVAQIIVLPLFRHLFVRLESSDNAVPA